MEISAIKGGRGGAQLVRLTRRHHHHHHLQICMSKKYSILPPFYGESELNSKNSFEIRRRMGDCEGDSATNGFTVCGVFSLGALLLTTSTHTFFLASFLPQLRIHGGNNMSTLNIRDALKKCV